MQKALPSNWKIKKLGEVVKNDKFAIVDGPFGTQLHAKDYTEIGIPVIRITNITRDNEFDDHNLVFISEQKFKSLTRSAVFPGDILLAKTGATIGKVAIFDNYEKALIASSCAKISINPDIANNKLVLYYLSTQKGQTQIIGGSSGSTRNSINLKEIANIKIPLPPLLTQYKIVEILEEADNLRKLRQQADEKMNDLIPSLFVQMFGDPVKNPKGWEVKKLGDITKRVTSQILPTDSPDTEFFYIGLEHIESNTGALINANHQKGEEIKSNKNKFEDGDVLYGKLRPYLNKVWLADRNGICSTDIWVLRPISKVTNGYFISTFLKFQRIVNILNLKTEGANLPRVKAISFDKVPLPLPPLPLQQEFAKLVEDIETEKARQAESKKKLDELFQSLMQRAFTGELAA